MANKIITIFGTGRAKSGDEIFDLAQRTGALLAEAGFTIANGGYGGTMLAAAKVARKSGGEVIGVTCSALSGKPNEYISREIVTASLDERLNKLIELGAGFVVLPGGTGTLLELAMVWELKNKGFLRQDKPVIIIGDFWKELVNTISRDDAGSIEYIEQADGPEKAVALLKARLIAGCL
jgi:uncharacterized protein (TIGR00730 family)